MQSVLRSPGYILLCCVCLLFLSSCERSGLVAQSSQHASTPGATATPFVNVIPTPVPTSTAPLPATSAIVTSHSARCPVSWQASNIDLPPLPAANNGRQVLVYAHQFNSSSYNYVTTFERYDSTTGIKKNIVTLGENEDIYDISLSPDGQWLLYITDHAPESHGDREIQIIRTDGKYLQTLWCGGVVGGSRWSPNQRYISFSGTNAQGLHGIFLLDTRAGAIHQIFSSPPDLNGMFVVQSWKDNTHIYLMKYEEQVSASPYINPPEQRIVYETANAAGPQFPPTSLYTLDLTRAGVQQVSDLHFVVAVTTSMTISRPDSPLLFIWQCQKTCAIYRISASGDHKFIFQGPNGEDIDGINAVDASAVMESDSQLLVSTCISSATGKDSCTFWNVSTDGNHVDHLISTDSLYAYISQGDDPDPWSLISRDGRMYAFVNESQVSANSFADTLKIVSFGSTGPIEVEQAQSSENLSLIGWASV